MKTYKVYFDVIFEVEAENEEEALEMVEGFDVPGAAQIQYAMTWLYGEEGMEDDGTDS